ncbi:hypothetical protein D3C85_1303350 [compost metagenome]
MDIFAALFITSLDQNLDDGDEAMANLFHDPAYLFLVDAVDMAFGADFLTDVGRDHADSGLSPCQGSFHVQPGLQSRIISEEIFHSFMIDALALGII